MIPEVVRAECHLVYRSAAGAAPAAVTLQLGFHAIDTFIVAQQFDLEERRLFARSLTRCEDVVPLMLVVQHPLCGEVAVYAEGLGRVENELKAAA